MPPKAKPSLLVVDDEIDIAQSVQDLLHFDYRVLVASRVSDALKILEHEPVNIVMSDQRMPEMTGVEFLSRLRDFYPDIVRLLFTAYTDLGVVVDAINQGSVYRYISKPWVNDELRAVLKQAVDYSQLQAEKRRLVDELQQINRRLEAANAELRHANDMKRAFIKVASHELRTPLTIVVGLSQLAELSPEVPPQPRQWVHQIHQAGLRLNDRVDQMVKMLQAEHFEHAREPREIALDQLLMQAVTDVQSFVSQRKQNFELDISPSLTNIWGEPDQLRDAVAQLLMNAIKFTHDGGTIRLQAETLLDGSARISVRDTGMGIDPACLPRIFEPFFTKYDVSRHSSGTFEYDRRGLGLGLSVAKAFVEMHGGRIEVFSKVNEGTTFTITLPPKPQGERASPADSEPGPSTH